MAKKVVKDGQNYLKSLSGKEKEILRSYINENTKTRYFNMSDGVINGLVTQDILSLPSRLSRRGYVFAYNIKPWAWEYLKENKHLLED